MAGPPDKWYKVSVSTTADANAQTSSAVLAGLNTNFTDVPGSFSLACSDGTFVFIGVYSVTED
jgi:hypothetical protein